MTNKSLFYIDYIFVYLHSKKNLIASMLHLRDPLVVLQIELILQILKPLEHSKKVRIFLQHFENKCNYFSNSCSLYRIFWFNSSCYLNFTASNSIFYFFKRTFLFFLNPFLNLTSNFCICFYFNFFILFCNTWASPYLITIK